MAASGQRAVASAPAFNMRGVATRSGRIVALGRRDMRHVGCVTVGAQRSSMFPKVDQSSGPCPPATSWLAVASMPVASSPR